MTSAIQTEGLMRRFGRTDAVRDLTLDVPEGSIFALIGPNGAGKTTTIKVLMNLLRPSAGSARILGTQSTSLGARELRRIGYVSENQRLPGWMSPRELIRFCKPMYDAWDDALAASLMRSLDLNTAAPLRSLSRGTRMKAALLVSLAYRPNLVVLDEPFTGLDPVIRDELIRALLETSGSGRWTVLVSSHDIDEVERLADRVGFLDDGRLAFSESTASLLARFRLIEATTDDSSAADRLRVQPGWIFQGMAGRRLQFVDTTHNWGDAADRITAALPGAAIRVLPMPLRDIFVVLARSRRDMPLEAK